MLRTTAVRVSAALAALALVVVVTNALAGASEAVNAPRGLALHGYDPVAYFTEGRPIKGDAAFAAVHTGAAYHFASAANREAFMKNPGKYAPQYGGWCAYGVALGKKFDVDPSAWKIVDGKLYLNLNPDVYKKWQADVPGFIAKADANWPKIRDKAAKDL
jgi:YHS domain-containing protein